jgi:hypothetical protein
MKIHHSTEYIDPSKNKEWYQLDVINQYYFNPKPVCFRYIDNNLIPYSLIHNVVIDSHCKSNAVLEVTKEMENELVSMGYTLTNQYN